jgi:hypothetical protein
MHCAVPTTVLHRFCYTFLGYMFQQDADPVEKEGDQDFLQMVFHYDKDQTYHDLFKALAGDLIEFPLKAILGTWQIFCYTVC